MKLLVISDIHGAVENVAQVINRESDAAGIVLCGDVTHFGGKEQAVPVIKTLRSAGVPLVSVHGNCDKPEVAEYLRREGISVHATWMTLAGIPVCGIGGSLPAPIYTPSVYTEQDGEKLLAELKLNLPEMPWIFITHQPPLKSSADRIGTGAHVGSKSVAEFIKAHKPYLVCTGHIHESFAVSSYGDSLLVNPGSLKDGRYAIVQYDSGNPLAKLKLL